MDEIKFKIALKVNDLYYFMMHHYYSKPAGIMAGAQYWFACVADHPMECDGCDG